MKIQASFVKDGKWWVAWTDDVPGALTQGATLEEARQNLVERRSHDSRAGRSFETPEEQGGDRAAPGIG